MPDVHYSADTEDERIVWITLARPDARNAYSDQMLDDLVAAFDRLAADSTARCAIITGEGPAFSAGGDLKAMRDKTGMFEGDPIPLRERYLAGIHRIPRRLARLDKPLIAAINGPAIGAGLDLACMCDLRVASSTASFGSTFVKVGLIPGDGGAYLLARTIGFPDALDLILSGRVIDADEALRLRLVQQVVPPEQLRDTARQRAARIADNPPLAVQLAKRLCYRSYEATLDLSLELAASYQGMVQNTADHLEGVNALLQRRPPSFSGH